MPGTNANRLGGNVHDVPSRGDFHFGKRLRIWSKAKGGTNKLYGIAPYAGVHRILNIFDPADAGAEQIQDQREAQEDYQHDIQG